MLTSIVDSLEKVAIDNLRMFFITRVVKAGHKKRDKVLYKYDFVPYQVDINDDIRSALFEYIQDQLPRLMQDESEIQDYEVVCDGMSKVLTYQLENKAMSFYDVLNTRLKAGTGITKVHHLADLMNGQELWAYCIELNLGDGKQIFTFTSLSAGKVAIDPEPKSVPAKILHPIKTINAMLDTNSAKLQLLKGESINLDKKIDCLFDGERFLIFNKGRFERIVGLEEEFKNEAFSVLEELSGCGLIDGIDLIKAEIEINPGIHRKLSKLAKIGQHKNLNAKKIKAMLKLSEEIGEKLKIEGGKIKVENNKDVELLVKLLSDYFKDSRITGNTYGTYAGSIVKKGATT